MTHPARRADMLAEWNAAQALREQAATAHEIRYEDTASKLQALGICPRELRDYLAGLE